MIEALEVFTLQDVENIQVCGDSQGPSGLGNLQSLENLEV